MIGLVILFSNKQFCFQNTKPFMCVFYFDIRDPKWRISIRVNTSSNRTTFQQKQQFFWHGALTCSKSAPKPQVLSKWLPQQWLQDLYTLTLAVSSRVGIIIFGIKQGSQKLKNLHSVSSKLEVKMIAWYRNRVTLLQSQCLKFISSYISATQNSR